MQETEVTVQLLDDFGTINKILLDQGFKMLENYQINDYYYSKYDFIKEMSYPEMIRNSFLVREIIDDHPFAMLTYKDKKFDDKGNVISEEKTKLRIASANEALEIFNSNIINFNFFILNSPSMGHIHIFQRGDTLIFFLFLILSLLKFHIYQ